MQRLSFQVFVNAGYASKADNNRDDRYQGGWWCMEVDACLGFLLNRTQKCVPPSTEEMIRCHWRRHQ